MGCGSSSTNVGEQDNISSSAGSQILASEKAKKKPSIAFAPSGGEARRKKLDKVDVYRRTSGLEDPLSIGKESESVSAPSRWLLVMGTSGSGKSSLIRQLKFAYDGLDESEALRYVKEVHKCALDACREVVKRLPALEGEKKSALDRIMSLRRRSPVTPDVAGDLKELWSEKAINGILENLSDPQTILGCRHFVPKLDELAAPDFVPDLQDLMFIRIPTMGQQETRLQNFPGGPLSVFEMKLNIDGNHNGLVCDSARLLDSKTVF